MIDSLFFELNSRSKEDREIEKRKEKREKRKKQKRNECTRLPKARDRPLLSFSM